MPKINRKRNGYPISLYNHLFIPVSFLMEYNPMANRITIITEIDSSMNFINFHLYKSFFIKREGAMNTFPRTKCLATR